MILSFFSIEISFASLSEIQNARGIMDVLAEMLSALEPGNKEVYLKCEENLEFILVIRPLSCEQCISNIDAE